MDFQKEFLKKIKTIFKFLETNKIEFCVCGGIAYSLLVYPRSTFDLGLILNISEKDIENLKSLLRKVFRNIIINEKIMKFGPASILRVVYIERQKEFILDLLILNEEYTKEILKRRIEVKIYNIKFPIISPDDLFILKSLTSRKQDEIDVEEIKKKYKINFRYVNKWLKKLKG